MSRDGTPRERLDAIVEKLEAFYDGGRTACLLETLSLGASFDHFSEDISTIFEAWVMAFARLAEEAGSSPELSQGRAESAVAQIQGRTSWGVLSPRLLP